MVAPVFNTPITRRNREGRDVKSRDFNGAGIQRSASDKSGNILPQNAYNVMRLPSRSNDCPTAPGSLPNRSCHMRRPRTTTWDCLRLRPRPRTYGLSSGWTPRACKKPDVTTAPFTCAALSLPARIEDRVPIDDAFEMIEDMVLSAVIEKVCRRDVRRIGYGSFPNARTRRSAFWNGRGRRRTAFTTEKIAVFAPMPSASVNTAMAGET